MLFFFACPIRFSHHLKYQFLGGMRNRRLDDLISILIKKTVGYFLVIHDLQAVGRMKKASLKSGEILKLACRLVEKGCINLISHAYLYEVPSEQTPGLKIVLFLYYLFIYCIYLHVLFQNKSEKKKRNYIFNCKLNV